MKVYNSVITIQKYMIESYKKYNALLLVELINIFSGSVTCSITNIN